MTTPSLPQPPVSPDTDLFQELVLPVPLLTVPTVPPPKFVPCVFLDIPQIKPETAVWLVLKVVLLVSLIAQEDVTLVLKPEKCHQTVDVLMNNTGLLKTENVTEKKLQPQLQSSLKTLPQLQNLILILILLTS